MSSISKTGESSEKAPSEAKDFHSVFKQELEAVLGRRRQLGGDAAAYGGSPDLPLGPPCEDSPVETAAQRLKILEHHALARDLCGLALSGGGIRSATFGLGVLQGLAAAGLLKQFDYLSTVSGGGYIGAWLSAWIRGDGIEQVEKRLCPPAFRAKSDEPIEPGPIRHLRLYSNYLAPRTGLFSFDGWTLIAIYLRNLLLNQLVLILFVFGLFAAIRFLVEGYALSYEWSSSWLLPIQGALGLYAGFVAACGAAQFAPHWHRQGVQAKKNGQSDVYDGRQSGSASPVECHLDGEPDERFDITRFWRVCMLPLLLVGICVSLLLTIDPKLACRLSPLTDLYQLDTPKANTLPPAAVVVDVTRRTIQFTAGFVAAAAISAFLIGGSLKRVSLQGQIPSIVGCGLVAGLLAGAVFGMAGLLLAHLGCSNGIPVATVATAGVPLFLGCTVLGTFLMTGLRGYAHGNADDSPEIQREWWSSVAARLTMLAIGWGAAVGCVVFGPWLLAGLWRIVAAGLWSSVAGGAFGVGWLATLAAGIRAAQMPATGSPNQRGPLDLLARVAPPMFVVTLLLLCTTAATWVMYEIHAVIETSPSWGFLSRQQTLLIDLNESKLEMARPILGGSMSVGWLGLLVASIVLVASARQIGQWIGPNVFSLQRLYRNRLVRCYLGASNDSRTPEPLVNLDDHDDVVLSSFFPGESSSWKPSEVVAPGTPTTGDENPDRCGPFHIINGALNQKASLLHRSQSETQDSKKAAAGTLKGAAENLQFTERQADSFVFTPLYCGSTATGYRPTHEYCGNIKVGEAIAVSGACVTPNMGYHSSPAITALLTVFNIRLGGWFPNPRLPNAKQNSTKPNPLLLLKEMAGLTDSQSDYVYVSDGGHFENMGVYELIRRRCRFILAVDAGADPKFHENVGRVVRQVRIDFGIWIEIDMKPVSPGPNGLAESHVVVGRIHYGHVDKVDPASQAQPAPESTTEEPSSAIDKVNSESQTQPAEESKPEKPSSACDNDASESPTQPERCRPTMSDDLNDPNFYYQENQGIIIWLKNSLTGDEPGDLVNHAAMHPEFPYDSTVDQFFSETQFESYRALGLHTVLESLKLSPSLRMSSPPSSSVVQEGGTSTSDHGANPVQLLEGGASAATTPGTTPVCSIAWWAKHRMPGSTSPSPPEHASADEIQPSSPLGTASKPQKNDSARGAASNAKSFVHAVFELNYNYWLTKPAQYIPNYVRENEAYSQIQRVLRQDSSVQRIANDLYGRGPLPSDALSNKALELTLSEYLMANEMFTLLENVWLSLDLERNRFHPVHAGWMEVFRAWTKSQILSAAWRGSHPASKSLSAKCKSLNAEYSPAFRRFIEDLMTHAD